MDPKRVKWELFQQEADVERAIEEQLPKPATVDDVRALAFREQWECSELIDDVVYCSTPARSDLPFVSAKWLIKFHFSGGQLDQTVVEKGLTGL